MGANPTLWSCIGGNFLKIEEKVEKIIQNPVENLGYSLYDVYYVKEGKDYFLRVIIDKPTGISLEDCEKVSNEINPILDEENIIKEQYFLEVSSPGIERVLRKEKQLQEAIGENVEVSLFQNLEGEKIFSGMLQEVTTEYVVLQIEGKEKKIERKNIAQIKTTFDWDE